MEICVEYLDLHQVKGSLKNSVILVIFQRDLTIQARPLFFGFQNLLPAIWLDSRQDRSTRFQTSTYTRKNKPTNKTPHTSTPQRKGNLGLQKRRSYWTPSSIKTLFKIVCYVQGCWQVLSPTYFPCILFDG